MIEDKDKKQDRKTELMLTYEAGANISQI
jgi:hypothetical protein